MRLYIGNLPFSTSEDQLRTLFEEHGTVDSVAIITDRETGRSRGFGFVEMPDEAGRNAMKALDDYSIDGRNLKVNEARPRPDRGERGGGGGRDRW